MGKTYEEIHRCVVAKVRAFCFEGASITDEEISAQKVSELRLTPNPAMPGVAPVDALAVQLRSCADVALRDLDRNKLNSPGWTVENVAQFIFGRTL